MKSPWEWTGADIDFLIANGVREDHKLDYKRCGALIPNPKKTKQFGWSVLAPRCKTKFGCYALRLLKLGPPTYSVVYSLGLLFMRYNVR
jgi:hypothetical protein